MQLFSFQNYLMVTRQIMFGQAKQNTMTKEEEKKLKKKEYDRMYRERNKEKIKEYNRSPKRRESYKKHNEKRKDYFKQYVEENKERRKEYYAREDIKERRKEYDREYRLKNKDRINEQVRLKKEKNPHIRLASNIRGLIGKAMSRNGFTKESKTRKILGCDFIELKEHLEKQFESWMNWDNYGKYNGQLNFGWDIDHIVPVDSAKTIEELYELNQYTNLRPLCSKFNRDIKRNKIL